METMTTPNGNKQAKPRTANTLADELRTEPGIPVYELRFRGQPGADLPLRTKQVNGGLNILRADKLIEIAYLPRMQFYRIVEASLSKDLLDVVVYVPREWATFEPAP